MNFMEDVVHLTPDHPDFDPITAPAVRLQSGEVFAGTKNHVSAARAAIAAGHDQKRLSVTLLLNPQATGYVTRSGRYLPREQAFEHVQRHGQWSPHMNSANVRRMDQRRRQGKTIGLDSGDIHFYRPALEAEGEPLARSLAIEERYHQPNQTLTLRVRRQDDPSVAANISLWRDEHDRDGEWMVNNIYPHTEGETPAPYRAMQGKFGPAHMRELARHLKTQYGVKTLIGFRITGARAQADKPDLSTAVALDKALPQIRAVDDTTLGGTTRLRTFDLRHPDGVHHARLAVLSDPDAETTGHVVNLYPMPHGDFVEDDMDRQHANHFGPAAMRHVARFLREQHGISKVRGHRVTGARNPGHGAEGGEGVEVERDLRKAEASPGAPFTFQLEHEHTRPRFGSNQEQTKQFRIVDHVRQRTAQVSLSRLADDPENHWQVDSIVPLIDGEPAGYERQHANLLGPATIRAFARHLREQHGITHVSGERITGTRAHNKVAPDNRAGTGVLWEGPQVERELIKGQPTFRTLDARWDDAEPGHRLLSVEMMHPDQQQGAVVHLWRHDKMEPGHFHLSDVEPVDHTQSIDGKLYSRNFANRLGPAVIRQAARYLKQTHGVTKLTGFRITGARHQGHGENGAEEGTPVETVIKSLERDTPRTVLTLRSSVHVARPTESRAALAPDDWHEEGTHPNPLNDAKRVVQVGDTMGTYKVRNHPYMANHATIEEVQAVTRGGGRAAMQHLIDHADRHGVALSLYANPLKPQGEGLKMPTRKLRSWYREFGFRPKQGDLMTRTPAKIVRKSWADAGDKPNAASEWTVKPFTPLREIGREKRPGSVQHARISAPNKPGAVMSFKHNAKTGHTEIVAFRAYRHPERAFDASERARQMGLGQQFADNVLTYHRSNVGVIGASGVRAAARYLKETIGAKTVGGLRVSGTRMRNENDLPKVAPRQVAGGETMPGVKVKRDLGKAFAALTALLAMEKSRASSPITFTKVNERTFGEGDAASTYHEYNFTHKDHPDTPFFLGTYTHAARPGHLEIESVEPRDEAGMHTAMHAKYKNILGATGMRHVFRALREHHPDTQTVAFDRLTGTRQQSGANRHVEKPVTIIKGERFADLLKTLIQVPSQSDWGSIFDYKNLGKDVRPVAQSQVFRPDIQRASDFPRYDRAVQQTLDAWKSPENRKSYAAGLKAGGHLWYHMDPLHRVFVDRHGPQEGGRRFDLFMDTIAGTSHGSEFGVNMRRAGAMFPFMLHGDPKRKLSSAEGLNHLFDKDSGLGTLAHQEMASALQNIREGKPRMTSAGLKVDHFSPNLKGNWRPKTADRHVGRQTGLGPAGMQSHVLYAAVEDASQHHAKDLYQRGTLPVADGRDPTAAFQSTVWIGDAIAGRVKSPPRPALSDFEHEIKSTAGKLGISHVEALHRFVDGNLHEFGGGAPGLKPFLTTPVRKSHGEDFDHLGDVSIAFKKYWQPTKEDPTAAHTFTLRNDSGDEAELYIDHDPREHKPGEHYVHLSSSGNRARNMLGPAGMRQVARYLQDRYGVKSVVAGRTYKDGEHKLVQRDLPKP